MASQVRSVISPVRSPVSMITHIDYSYKTVWWFPETFSILSCQKTGIIFRPYQLRISVPIHRMPRDGSVHNRRFEFCPHCNISRNKPILMPVSILSVFNPVARFRNCLKLLLMLFTNLAIYNPSFLWQMPLPHSFPFKFLPICETRFFQAERVPLQHLNYITVPANPQ